MIHYDSLLQNETDVITKYDSYFVSKCDKALLQIASRFLLQNATVLLQNARILLQNATVITECDVYHKLQQYTVLSTEGKIPVIKERFNKSATCFEIPFLEEIIFYAVYYLGQKPYQSWQRIWCFLFISRLQKYCATSFNWKIVWKVFMWIFYAFFRSFSYRDKVIIKGICNNIGTGYSMTIIKGEHGRYTGCYGLVFREIRDLIPFHVSLKIIQISLTIFIIISLFTFLHKGRK